MAEAAEQGREKKKGIVGRGKAEAEVQAKVAQWAR